MVWYFQCYMTVPPPDPLPTSNLDQPTKFRRLDKTQANQFCSMQTARQLAIATKETKKRQSLEVHQTVSGNERQATKLWVSKTRSLSWELAGQKHYEYGGMAEYMGACAQPHLACWRGPYGEVKD